jgi:hypothetical protein
MVAEPNRAAVTVDCRVSHIENGQSDAASRFAFGEPVVPKGHLPLCPMADVDALRGIEQCIPFIHRQQLDPTACLDES